VRVRHGWSGEYKSNQWGKFDVDLDESDVHRLLHEAGLADAAVTTTEAFLLLNSEAQRLLISGMMARYDYPRTDGLRDIEKFGQHRDGILATIRAKGHGPKPPADTSWVETTA